MAKTFDGPPTLERSGSEHRVGRLHPLVSEVSVPNKGNRKGGGPIPHNMAKTFDGPPTLERSGSEHRVGRLHPLVSEVSVPNKGNRKGRKNFYLI